MSLSFGVQSSNERNQDATLFVGELESQVTESLLWELFLQAGPVGKEKKIFEKKKTKTKPMDNLFHLNSISI